MLIQVQCYDPEVVGLQLCSKSIKQIQGNKQGTIVEPMMDLAQIAEASTKLSSMLDSVLQYVDDVLSKKTLPDNQVIYSAIIKIQT